MSNDESIKQFQKDGKQSKIISTITIISICILIGIPIWWTTTTVYRASLPYEEISDLIQFENIIKINLNLIICGGITSPSVSEQLISKEINKNARIMDGLIIKYKFASRNAMRSEIETIKSYSSIKEFDQTILSANDYLQILLIPESLKPKSISNSDIIVGLNKNVYIFMDNKGFTNDLVLRLSVVIKNILVNELSLKNALTSINNRTIKNTQRLKSFDYSTEYDIVFTMMNSKPDLIKWNIKKSINNYMSPLIDSLSEYSIIKVISQVVYHNDIGVRPKKTDKRYTLTVEQLPVVINTIEPSLGSHTSVNPTLNIVVYASTGYSPLQIVDKGGEPVKSNAFLSSRWGAFIIANTNHSSGETSLDDRTVMATALSQIRNLLGFRNVYTATTEIDEYMEILNPGNKIISEWELRQWVILRCYSNLITSISTLNALSTLLAEITNIVINDEIGRTVEESLQAIYKTRLHLKLGNIKKAFEYSKISFTASEKAFFDPSLLGLLYFPEEQKFAIYVPLFLPIAMSFIISIKEFIQYLKVEDANKIKTS